MVAGVAALLRLGFLADFISPPVLKGLIIGLALTIIAGQLPKLLGISGGTGHSSSRHGTSSPTSARSRGRRCSSACARWR